MKSINFFLTLFAICIFVACGSNHDHAHNTDGSHSEEHAGHDHDGHNHEGHDHSGEGHMNKTMSLLELGDFPKSVEFADAALTKMAYAAGNFDFDYTGTDYQLGEQTSDASLKMCANSAKGQHIHLIVDNEPYAAKYTSEFEYDIADGEHYILAFLSRSYHESIKNGKAAIMKKVNVVNKSIEKEEAIEEPMLFYSRPKGTYIGNAATQKVMLDFFLANVELGSDYKVKVEVNNNAGFMLDTWKPYFLEGLPMGDNKVKLTLVDAEGKTIDTPLNPVERVFTLKADQAESK